MTLPPHFWILAPFAAVHCVWIVLGLTWALGEIASSQPVKTVAELKARANQARHWYLNPFHDRTLVIWKYAAWATGLVWLAAGLFSR